MKWLRPLRNRKPNSRRQPPRPHTARPGVEALEDRFLLAVNAHVAIYPTPITAADNGGITRGPDGNLWYTKGATNRVGKVTLNGEVTEIATAPGSLPFRITTGSDGNLWFTDRARKVISRITPQGAVKDFAVPGGAAGVATRSITVAPDGNLWFTETGDNKVGRITPSGTVTEFPL